MNSKAYSYHAARGSLLIIVSSIVLDDEGGKTLFTDFSILFATQFIRLLRDENVVLILLDGLTTFRRRVVLLTTLLLTTL